MYVLMYVEREREIRKELEAVLVAEAALVVEKLKSTKVVIEQEGFLEK